MNKRVYLIAGESYMVQKSVNEIKQSLNISLPEINITEFKSLPKGIELKDACVSVPFMSETRLVTVTDCSAVFSAKGGAEDSAKISDAIDLMPDTTVLVLCSGEAPDKRRALYKKIKSDGQIKEFGSPGKAECVDFVITRAKIENASITRKNAEKVVDTAGCDYFTLQNEICKLAAYSGYGEINEKQINECVSHTLEYNVFEIHSLLAAGKANEAERLLYEIMREERPEAIIGLVARKLRDMYKIKALISRGDSPAKAASIIGMKEFAAEILARECRRFTLEELRKGLLILADIDYGIKSGETDAELALPVALPLIYKIGIPD